MTDQTRSVSTTQVITRPDGSEALLLQQARLAVVRGQDRGAVLEMTKRRVRVGTGSDCDLRLQDPGVSRHHLELQATEEGFLLRDLRSTNGTKVGGVRLQRALITQPTELALGDTILRIEPLDEALELPLSGRGQFGGLLGRSAAMRQVFAQLEAVARADSTVLLEGESGTGKELAAEALHQASGRRRGPLAVVDCGSLPATLIESELFGHVRGAFSGADRARRGVLEEADGGTVFLDEIGELPLALQPRLLRFLERQQVKPVGASEHRQVDVRVVAATNRVLVHEVAEGRFRKDLYYRLSVVRVELPPLRERPEDVVLLAHHFALPFVSDPAELVTAEIETLLLAHDWPGNARELRNAVERIAVAPGLGTRLPGQAPGPGTIATPADISELADLPFHEGRKRWQDLFERRYLRTQLERAGGVVARAAELAGIPRQSMYRLLDRHGLGKGGADRGGGRAT